MKKIFMNSNFILIMITLLAIIILVLIPTGFEKVVQPNSVRAKAEILEVDNSLLRQYGIVREGDQVCKIKILNGKFKGQEISGGVNHLTGKMEMDKIFEPGDKAFVVLDTKDGKITFANLVDHYRINLELVLFAAFILILILFAGWTGVKSVLSFTLTVLIIWKILIPGFLKGYNPIILSLLVVTAMTVSTILLVSGTNKKSIVAILGSLSGSALTCILSIIFGYYFKVHGALMPFSETLMYSGYANLKLTDIFIAGIFVASAGALMDLAMDISAAIHEIVEKNPEITRHEAIKSGFSIGRAVMGTMTTTLLLAYSGGYVALLMVFMAQGTPVENILNLRYVSGEILHTIVGSFGLVTVAPFTAILAGVFFVPDQAVNLIENDSH